MLDAGEETDEMSSDEGVDVSETSNSGSDFDEGIEEGEVPEEE